MSNTSCEKIKYCSFVAFRWHLLLKQPMLLIFFPVDGAYLHINICTSKLLLLLFLWIGGSGCTSDLWLWYWCFIGSAWFHRHAADTWIEARTHVWFYSFVVNAAPRNAVRSHTGCFLLSHFKPWAAAFTSLPQCFPDCQQVKWKANPPPPVSSPSPFLFLFVFTSRLSSLAALPSSLHHSFPWYLLHALIYSGFPAGLLP